MPGGLSEPMEPRFRVRHLRLLGTLTVVLALASCGGDSTQESTSTAASSTTTTPSSIATTTPSSTTTTPSSTTSTPAVFLSAMVIEDDHPSSGDDATPVEIGTATQGELEHDYDSDVFAFEATGGERYELDVTLGTLQDSVLVLYDADDSRLFGNDDYADSTASRLIWLAPATGTYYALVHSFGTGTGTYTLTITISDIEDDHPNSTDNATPRRDWHRHPRRTGTPPRQGFLPLRSHRRRVLRTRRNPRNPRNPPSLRTEHPLHRRHLADQQRRLQRLDSVPTHMASTQHRHLLRRDNRSRHRHRHLRPHHHNLRHRRRPPKLDRQRNHPSRLASPPKANWNTATTATSSASKPQKASTTS